MKKTIFMFSGKNCIYKRIV